MSTKSAVQMEPTGLRRDSDLPWHLGFGALMAVTLIAFTLWSRGYAGGGANGILLITAILFAMFMAFNIGGNDVANSFGPSVGAGTLTMKQALLVAALFEVSGAVLAGGEVTSTVRSGIVDLGAIDIIPMDFVYIMMSALLGAALWLLVATRKGWPVSTTHSIVGGIVGGALTIGVMTGTGGMDMVQWGKIGQIAGSWIVSPLLGGLASWVIFKIIKSNVLVYSDRVGDDDERVSRDRHTLDADAPAHADRQMSLDFPGDDPVSAAEAKRAGEGATGATDGVSGGTGGGAPDGATDRTGDVPEGEPAYHGLLASHEPVSPEIARPVTAEATRAHHALEMWVPPLAALGAAVIGSMLLFKGLKNLKLEISLLGNVLILLMAAAAAWMTVLFFARILRKYSPARSTFLLFSWMQVFTASAFAFSHGSNDIANAIGPFVAVLDVLKTNQINSESAVPLAVLVAMGIALVCGLWFIGRNVIKTVGQGLTKMHPASGFAAELSAAAVVMAASVLGIPVSSTHILIGAVLGVGIVNKAANWKLMKPIATAWVITLPAAAAISAVGVVVLRAIFG